MSYYGCSFPGCDRHPSKGDLIERVNPKGEPFEGRCRDHYADAFTEDQGAAADCYSCGEPEAGSCPKSKRACGHHCNCSWVHDHCHWCGQTFGEEPMGTDLECEMCEGATPDVESVPTGDGDSTELCLSCRLIAREEELEDLRALLSAPTRKPFEEEGFAPDTTMDGLHRPARYRQQSTTGKEGCER